MMASSTGVETGAQKYPSSARRWVSFAGPVLRDAETQIERLAEPVSQGVERGREGSMSAHHSGPGKC